MKALYGSGCVDYPKGKLAVGLGNFDGLHVGHMSLVNTLINEARINGLQSMIYTFTKHPENILWKSLFTPLLTTVAKKVKVLEETALDYLYFDDFDEDYSKMAPEQFVRDILVGRLGVKLVVAGFDYRFGYKGEGDTAALKRFGKEYGFKVEIIPPIKIDSDVVSSTLIRKLVSSGDMEGVFELLGRHYSITGEVKDGRRIGRRIGFPTANLIPEEYLIMPQNGIYVTKTFYEGKCYSSVTNVGINPTFDVLPRVTVETHILDFSKDIYNNSIEVFFLTKLRDEVKFNSAEELTEQIRLDVLAAKEYFDLNGTC